MKEKNEKREENRWRNKENQRKKIREQEKSKKKQSEEQPKKPVRGEQTSKLTQSNDVSEEKKTDKQAGPPATVQGRKLQQEFLPSCITQSYSSRVGH